jgi:hypothetical protein
MMKPGNDESPDAGFDLLRNDLTLRWQRKLRLAPAQGLGVVRRAIFFALLTWLPIVVWAAVNQRLLVAETGEPLLAHFGIHVRCLVAIPLFILAEAMASQAISRIVTQFRVSGLISDQQLPAFKSALKDVARFRDSSMPWVVVIGLVVAWTLGSPVHADSDQMSWALEGKDFGFGGWWFLYVARPIFLVLLLGWLWRITLGIMLFYRLSRLELSLVPTHPDRNGGLGFVNKLPNGLFLVTLAVSSVLASGWMHDVVYHEQTLDSLKFPFVVFVILWSAIVLAPLLMFAPRIAGMKRKALLSYGALIGEHGRLVHQRWILGQPVTSDDLLGAPELGPVADTSAIYEAVKRVSAMPIDKSTVLMVVIPLVLPMLFVVAQQIPIAEVLRKLATTII